MPDVTGVDPATKQAVYDKPDDESKRECFEKRRKVDGRTEHQILSGQSCCIEHKLHKVDSFTTEYIALD